MTDKKISIKERLNRSEVDRDAAVALVKSLNSRLCRVVERRDEAIELAKDLKNKNKLLQESVDRMQAANAQYEVDLDEAQNLAEIYRGERDKFYGQMEQAKQYRDNIQAATGYKGVVDVNVNGKVVITINVK